jgi:hypothetical protein
MRLRLFLATTLLFGCSSFASAQTPDEFVIPPGGQDRIVCDDGVRLSGERIDQSTVDIFCAPVDTTTTTAPPGDTPWPDSSDEVGLHGQDGSGFPPAPANINCPSGCVYDGVQITGPTSISGVDVVIRNSWITYGSIDARGTVGLTVEDSYFSGHVITPEGPWVFQRNYVDRGTSEANSFMFSGVDNGSNHDIVIEDNYMDRNGWTDPDEHGDGIQSWGFGTITNVRIARNYVDATNMNMNPPCDGAGIGVNAALFLSDALYAGVVDVLDNYFYLEGSFWDPCGQSSYYLVRLDGKGTRATATTTVTGNLVHKPERFPESTTAHVRCWTLNPPIVWTDNWLDDGQPYLFPGNSPCE